MSNSQEENAPMEANHVDVVMAGEGGPGEPAEEQPEEEKTLTDHLNKKLLESFLTRLESGGEGLPSTAAGVADNQGQLEADEDEWEEQT